MHELSLCRAIADIATARAGERTVSVVHLEVGQLRQVVPDTLTYCWALVVEDGPLSGSRLEIRRIDAAVRCRTCGAEHVVGDSMSFACRACAGIDVAVVAGEELHVCALDLVGS
jgi:hydrogenase nickel incorporation protein HypA/HybF